MNLAYKFAKRYLVSKKTTNAINILSGVSVIGMIVGTTALILVLSVFNGFEDLVKSLYNSFNPDLKITAIKGKVFLPDAGQIAKMENLSGVEAVSKVLEENALIQYNDKDIIARLKGVDENYVSVSQVDTAIYDGEYKLQEEEYNFAVLGIGIAAMLGLNVNNQFARLNVFMPKREGKVSRLKPENAFAQKTIYPGGVFAIQQDFDSEYVIVPMRFMRDILAYPEEVSALEIALSPEANHKSIQKEIVAIMGGDFQVKNRQEQDALLYAVMKLEKWVVYLILTFILIIASFNMIGSLSMLVMEKKHDIGILKAMGAGKQFIRRIFLMESVLLAFLGASIGIVLAVIICLIQEHYGIIKLQGMSFLIDAYPVSMRLGDFVLVFITVMVISVLAALFPAYRAAEQSQLLYKE